MNLRQNGSTWTQLAPAKINLFLEILGLRTDGYHELETLLVPVRIYDSLSFLSLAPRDGDSAGVVELRVCTSGLLAELPPNDEQVPTGRQNLVVRALELLRKRSGCPQGAIVDLVKRIPMAAGLGGGSSDASAALKLANLGWGLGWDDDRLRDLAAELGSDVPFFVNGGAAICRGCGERVERVAGIRPLDVVILKPPAGLSTADVYRSLDAGPAPNGAVLERLVTTLRRGSLVEIGRQMRNRLQTTAAQLSPWVERARAVFAELDFLGHQLSGSGTAYFGVCRHAQHARRLATILRKLQLGLVYVTRSCL